MRGSALEPDEAREHRGGDAEPDEGPRRCPAVRLGAGEGVHQRREAGHGGGGGHGVGAGPAPLPLAGGLSGRLATGALAGLVEPTTDERVASLIFTSGTTGAPKGVMLSHRNFTSLLGSLEGMFRISERDGFVSVLPLPAAAAVGVAMLAGAALEWVPSEPHPLRQLFFTVAYIAGGYRIALDSWEAMKKRRLSIDFLMGAAAVGAAVVGSELEGVVLIFLFSLIRT